MCLASYASFGIIWRRKGRQVTTAEAAAVILAPHSSFLDVGVGLLMLDELPYAISRAETLNAPLIGSRYLIHSQPQCLDASTAITTCSYFS